MQYIHLRHILLDFGICCRSSSGFMLYWACVPWRQDLEFALQESRRRRMRDPPPTHFNAAAPECTARIQAVLYQIQSTHFASFSTRLVAWRMGAKTSSLCRFVTSQLPCLNAAIASERSDWLVPAWRHLKQSCCSHLSADMVNCSSVVLQEELQNRRYIQLLFAVYQSGSYGSDSTDAFEWSLCLWIGSK